MVSRQHSTCQNNARLDRLQVNGELQEIWNLVLPDLFLH
jgi:hypothetical protein